MKEVSLEGKTYRIGNLDVFSQLDVARKLGFASAFVEGIVRVENAEKDLAMLTVLALGKLSDADSALVVRKCLSAVIRVEGDKAFALTNNTGTLQYEDLSMHGMVRLVAICIEYNLGGFFRTALGGLVDAVKKT